MALFPFLPTPTDVISTPGKIVRDNGTAQLHASAVVAAAVGQFVTITATAPANSTTYAGNVSGGGITIPFSVTTDASATAAELAILIGNALNANVTSGLIMNVAIAGSTVVVTDKTGAGLTVAFTVNPGAVLTQATTAAVPFVQYRFGRAVELTALQRVGNVMAEIASPPDNAAVVSKLALVLDPGNVPMQEPLVGDATIPVGPLLGSALLVAKAGAKNWYAVEAPAGTPGFGDPVYVEGAAGANNGLLLTASSGTTVTWAGVTWVGKFTDGGITVAVIEM